MDTFSHATLLKTEWIYSFKETWNLNMTDVETRSTSIIITGQEYI